MNNEEVKRKISPKEYFEDFVGLERLDKTTIEEVNNHKNISDSNDNIVSIETLVSGKAGSFIVEEASSMFGFKTSISRGDAGYYEVLGEELDRFLEELGEVINSKSQLEGQFSFGYNEHDGGLDLFYQY